MRVGVVGEVGVAGWRFGGREFGERGAVSVEAALGLGVVVGFLFVGVEVVMAVVGHVRCVDAAREAARLVARGESERAVVVAREVAPREARIVVREEGDSVLVEVVVLRFGIDVSGRAFAVMEPRGGEGG
jgi:TadE-like protein